MSGGAEKSLTKTQLDKLGDRLRDGTADEADLRALDEYRRSFRESYDLVSTTVATALGLRGTGRPAKTTAAITAKLRRQRIRLTQVQDIAGLRLIAKDVLEQDGFVLRLNQALSNSSTDDRRDKPSHGYRAVHVIANVQDRLVEIQIRTPEQHLWAELSERLSDEIDPAVKYGGGPDSTRETLLKYSDQLAEIEEYEREDARLAAELMEKDDLLKRTAPTDSDYGNRRDSVTKLRRYLAQNAPLTRELKESIRSLLIRYNQS